MEHGTQDHGKPQEVTGADLLLEVGTLAGDLQPVRRAVPKESGIPGGEKVEVGVLVGKVVPIRKVEVLDRSLIRDLTRNIKCPVS